jgi:hypothetical protein
MSMGNRLAFLKKSRHSNEMIGSVKLSDDPVTELILHKTSIST